MSFKRLFGKSKTEYLCMGPHVCVFPLKQPLLPRHGCLRMQYLQCDTCGSGIPQLIIPLYALGLVPRALLHLLQPQHFQSLLQLYPVIFRSPETCYVAPRLHKFAQKSVFVVNTFVYIKNSYSFFQNLLKSLFLWKLS